MSSLGVRLCTTATRVSDEMGDDYIAEHGNGWAEACRAAAFRGRFDVSVRAPDSVHHEDAIREWAEARELEVELHRSGRLDLSWAHHEPGDVEEPPPSEDGDEGPPRGRGHGQDP